VEQTMPEFDFKWLELQEQFSPHDMFLHMILLASAQTFFGDFLIGSSPAFGLCSTWF